jgi:anti-sigma regulatory factor (Ser/Thr protein kinase)
VNRLRLRIAGHRSPSSEVAEYVAQLAKRTGLSPSQQYRLRLAADEIAANVTEHGYRCEGGILDLDCGETPDSVWLSIEDDAPPFDPTRHSVRAARSTRLIGSGAGGAGGAVVPTGRMGGYGVQLALSCADEFRYDYIDGRNRSTLLVHRNRTDGRGHR